MIEDILKAKSARSKIKNILRHSTAALISLLFCFLIGEVIIRIFLMFNTLYDIEMARYSLGIKIDSKNPCIGHVQKPNMIMKLMDVTVCTNSDGLRDIEYPVPRSDKARFILLGDSITFGWGVEQKDAFENILETELNKWHPTEIINFGTGNYNTEQEVNLFFEKGLKYKPDKVVVFYFINDAEPTPHKSRFWFLGYSRLATLCWSSMNIVNTRLNPSRNYVQYYKDLYKNNQKGLSRAKNAFLQLMLVCQKNNISLQVVLLPELHGLKDYPFRNEHEIIMQFLKAHNINALDLAPYFSYYENPRELWVARDDPHPNTAAHKLIAQYAINFIK
ncbi:MAG: SGNH/GDSL hydrolase family protein [Candidatus Omnitrophica bacterium]|nr:SGNH/GDSL hydrolase family protein [Candidatus Omnitrophota bacterium]